MDAQQEHTVFSDIQFDVRITDGPVSEGLLYVQSSWGYRTICGLRIRKGPVRTVAMLTERFDNPGIPITQHIAPLCECIHNSLLKFVPFSEIVWIEHYDARRMPFGRKTESYAVVSFDYEKIERTHRYANPRWEPVEKDKAILLLNS
ncbi:MAG: hypothetical protein OHK006_23780 [Thermodesulfovibrionales bacterium]